MTYFTNRPSTLPFTDGTAATTGNNAAPDGFTVTTANSGNITWQSGRWMFNATTTGQVARFDRTTNSLIMSSRTRFDQTGLPAVADGTDCAVVGYNSAGSSGGGVRVARLPTGQYRLYNYANTSLWTSANSYNGDHEIDLSVDATTTGYLGCWIYPGGSNTAAESWDGGTNVGTNPFTTMRIGKITSAPTVTMRVVNIQGDDQALVDFTSLTQPTDTSNAGPDQTVEPWSTVTLTGTGSGTGVWSQTGGLTATLTGSGSARAFTAPPSIAGGVLVFRHTVGAVNDEMAVTVLPVTERAVVGGVEVPLRIS